MRAAFAPSQAASGPSPGGAAWRTVTWPRVRSHPLVPGAVGNLLYARKNCGILANPAPHRRPASVLVRPFLALSSNGDSCPRVVNKILNLSLTVNVQCQKIRAKPGNCRAMGRREAANSSAGSPCGSPGNSAMREFVTGVGTASTMIAQRTAPPDRCPLDARRLQSGQGRARLSITYSPTGYGQLNDSSE